MNLIPAKPLKLVALLVLLAALSLPVSAAPSPVRYEDSHDAMGTVFTVVAYGQNSEYLSEVVREVFEEIDRLDAQMSNYKPESELSNINREAAERAVIVEPELFALIQDSMRLSVETDGAFDITVGPLLKAWGFFRGRGRLPSSLELASVMKRVGYRHVKLDAARREIRFDAPGIELDLGAIAKGYALDRAAETLRANGVTQALISCGTSSFDALDSPPGEKGWKISIRNPYDKQKAADTVWLKNYSLSVSGNYEKFFTLRGKTYSHIFNPKTGRPVEGMLSTAVLAPKGEMTDGLSTSFYVLGPQRSRALLANHANVAVIFYVPGNSQGNYRRIVLRSDSYHHPPGSLAEIEGL
jgi:thiamine biosynthesis lipoprotein